jgi:hypothetical protein
LAGSSLTVNDGQTVSLNQNNMTDLEDGVLIVNGTVDFSGNRWSSGGIGTHMIIYVNGTWFSSGNFYSGVQKSIAINVNGSFAQKLSSFGSTVDYGGEVRTNVVNVGSGGSYTAFGGLTLTATERNVTAVNLTGGTMVIPSGANYDYTSLVLSGDDGIIFKDAASEIVLAGNRTNDVNTWVGDEALSSQVGELIISYSSSEDATVVQPLSVPTEIGEVAAEMISEGLFMSWDGAAGVTYVVESTDDLVDGIWSNAFSAVGSGGTLSVTGSVDMAQEFYRVTIEE